ncbi:MarR family transcriptional regulator [Saccharothrix longispora]|uniref:MarR family winged helix-turn-helix transcriptional regulator n=1 Tax=Saccharothrix longispora TaxID=33920 RepID=UPI0028FDA622|nr:MarR family transcriptional regulator [Saccharothrix longispora]MBY8849283.1 MarR family transcriptional regulator [Saccharothrix sp. MB29]MDU0294104.1 MarR family transcriptional regulator [Saccharothrix longispora]
MDVPPLERGSAVDDLLCFALYAASRAVTAAYRPLLQDLGLTYPQYLVMLALWDRGEPMPVKDLGDALQLDYGTLTPLLKRLETAGLVTRRRRADDERSVLVGLTDEGRALQGSTGGVTTSIGEAMGLPEVEVDRLRESLRHLAANVAAHNAR